MNRIYYNREAQERAERDRVLLAIIATFVGMVWGMVLALLFAPQSGEETRRQLTEQAERVASQGREMTDQISRDLRTNASQLRDDVNERLHTLDD